MKPPEPHGRGWTKFASPSPYEQSVEKAALRLEAKATESMFKMEIQPDQPRSPPALHRLTPKDFHGCQPPVEPSQARLGFPQLQLPRLRYPVRQLPWTVAAPI